MATKETTRISSLKKNAVLLTKSLQAVRNDFQMSKVAELDKHVANLLTKIKADPQAEKELTTELANLKANHQKVLVDCRNNSKAIKQSLEYLQQNREGLLAYQEMDK